MRYRCITGTQLLPDGIRLDLVSAANLELRHYQVRKRLNSLVLSQKYFKQLWDFLCVLCARVRLLDGGRDGEKITTPPAAQRTNLQLGFSVFVAERVIGPCPVGVGVAEPLTVLSAVFSGPF